MRIFDHPNMTNFKCPICGTNDDKSVVLVGIAGTEDDGNIEATQVHLNCLELAVVDFKTGQKIIYQVFDEK